MNSRSKIDFIDPWSVIPVLIGLVYPPIFILFFSLIALPRLLVWGYSKLPRFGHSKLQVIFDISIFVLGAFFYVLNILYLSNIDFGATDYYRHIRNRDFSGVIAELFKNNSLLFKDIWNLRHDMATGNYGDNFLLIILLFFFLIAIVISLLVLVRPVLRWIFRILSNFFKLLSEEI